MKKSLILLSFLLVAFAGMSQNVCPPNVEHFDFYFNTPVISGQKVGGVNYCEPDTLQTDTWSINDPLSLFTINSTGDILVMNPATVNSNGTYIYDLSVTITDNGIPPLFTTSTITLYATKPNEPPVIIAQ